MGVRLADHVSPDYHDEKSLSGDRHFVIWTDKEDRILRDQVRLLGTDKWPMIASHLGNKTGRQCRRRWQLCLNVPSKKGGWTLEEDRVLFEAHQKHGNRWTEIAKVLPGRTDNAVKNRFTSLVRKHARESECSQTESSGDMGSDLKPMHKRRGSDHFSDSNTPNYSSSKRARSDGSVQALTPDSVLQQNWRGFLSGAFASPISEDGVSCCALNRGGGLAEESRIVGLYFDGHHDSRACSSVLTESWKEMEWLAMAKMEAPVSSSGLNYYLTSFSDRASDGPMHEQRENKGTFSPHLQHRPLTVGDLPESTGHFCVSPDSCAHPRVISFESVWDQQASVDVQQDVACDCIGGAAEFGVQEESQSSFGNAEDDLPVKQESDEASGPLETTGAEHMEENPSELQSDIPVESPPRTTSQQSVRTPVSLTPSSRHLMNGMPSPQFSDTERQFLLSALEGCQLSVLDSPVGGQAVSPCRRPHTLTNKKIRGPLLDASYDTPCRSPLSSYLLQRFQGSPVTTAVPHQL